MRYTKEMVKEDPKGKLKTLRLTSLTSGSLKGNGRIVRNLYKNTLLCTSSSYILEIKCAMLLNRKHMCFIGVECCSVMTVICIALA